MPAQGVRVTMFMQDDLFGFSETHVLLQATDLSNGTQQQALNLFKARLKISGFGVQPIGVRLSLVGQSRASITLDPSTFAGIAPTAQQLSGAGVETEANITDQAKSALQLKAYSGFQRKNIYLGGIPDPIVGEMPRVGRPALYSVWYNLYLAYVAVLTGNSPQWGFICRNSSGAFAPVNGAGWAQNQGNGQLGMVVSTAVQTYQQGQIVQIKGVKRSNVAYQTANGIWQIASVAAGVPGVGFNTYYLLNSAQVSATTLTSFGQIQGVDYKTAQYTSVAIAGQTTRKRGNRFLVPVGRRRVVKRLTF